MQDNAGTPIAAGAAVARAGHRKRLLKRLSGMASSSSPQLNIDAKGYRSQEAANSCICFTDRQTIKTSEQRLGQKDGLVRLIELELPLSPTARSGELCGSRSHAGVTHKQTSQPPQPVDFLKSLPPELRIHVLGFLELEELVRCSAVSKLWRNLCFDGQLWSDLETRNFYKKIPAEQLSKIISSSGPFIRFLDLTGCVQLQNDFSAITSACKNLLAVSVEGCLLEKPNVHRLLAGNTNLVLLNLSRLTSVTNATCRHISESCKNLKSLNISYCMNIDGRGLRKILDNCKSVTDLRASECRGLDDPLTLEALHNTTKLRVLFVAGCDSLTDESVRIIVEGLDPEIDPLTNKSIAPPRALKQLDLSRCTELTDQALVYLADRVPDLEGLDLGRVSNITDAGLLKLIPTVPKLSHLDLEECAAVSDATLVELAKASCSRKLKHIQLSFCEGISDAGLITLVKCCERLRNIELDNTRTGDRFLEEATRAIATRRLLEGQSKGAIGLRIVVFDCINVNWTGVKNVLQINTETLTKANEADQQDYASQVVQLKCFHEWQQTVDEITKRMLTGNGTGANKMLVKWGEFMAANEEPATNGTRRRRRRAREAAGLVDDDFPGRRRRGRGTGCTIM